jgi:hypothetical protein
LPADRFTTGIDVPKNLQPGVYAVCAAHLWASTRKAATRRCDEIGKTVFASSEFVDLLRQLLEAVDNWRSRAGEK